jgi:hypothetical protein
MMTKHLSESELAKLEALCAEAGTDVPHLVAEARRWKAIAGRLGLSLDILLDTLSSLEEAPRDPTSADWRKVEHVAAEGSLAELRHAQQESGYGRTATPGGDSRTEHQPRGSPSKDG